ncbi:MAG: sel1 repeat family protein [Planctomycetes bacterium]|nr:sel1 repeat family protein [Planctomycetota bacterium]
MFLSPRFRCLGSLARAALVAVLMSTLLVAVRAQEPDESGTMEDEPAWIPTQLGGLLATLAIDATEERTACDGATIERFAVSDYVLYAATSRGVYASKDAREWTRLAGIDTSAHLVAATGGLVVAATKEGLHEHAEEGDRFAPVDNARFVARALRGGGGNFVALAEDGRVHTRDFQGWKAVELAAGTRVLDALVDVNGMLVLLATGADGFLHTFEGEPGALTDRWLPYRAEHVRRATLLQDTLLLELDPASGARLVWKGTGRSAFQYSLDGAVVFTSLDDGVITTEAGELLLPDAGELLVWHAPGGKALRTAVRAGPWVVAAGAGGALVHTRTDVDTPASVRRIPGTPVELQPAGWSLPDGARLDLEQPLQPYGEPVRRATERDVLELHASGETHPWRPGLGYDVAVARPPAEWGPFSDVAASDELVVLVGEKGLLREPRKGAVNDGLFSQLGGVRLRRVFHGGGAWLLVNDEEGFAVTADFTSFAFTQAMKPSELRGALFHDGAWYVVGARGAERHAALLLRRASDGALEPIELAAARAPLNAIVRTTQALVAVGDAGHVASSSDGRAWSVRALDGAPDLVDAAALGAQVVARSKDGRAFVSEDLATWRELPGAGSVRYRLVAALGDELLALAPEFTLRWRTPASAWSARPAIAARELAPAPPSAAKPNLAPPAAAATKPAPSAQPSTTPSTAANAPAGAPTGATKPAAGPNGPALFDLVARRRLAEIHVAAACYDLAHAYWNGLGVREDDAEGTRWFERATARGWKLPASGSTPEEQLAAWRAIAEQGSIVGKGMVCELLAEAQGAARDETALRGALFEAAKEGHVPSMFQLGLAYARGALGIDKDSARALEWMTRAADLGHGTAAEQVAYRYWTGADVARDRGRAMSYWWKGLEAGNRVAIGNIARCYAEGEQVATDRVHAAALYLKAAGIEEPGADLARAYARLTEELDRGNTWALAVLAILELNGHGTRKDPTRALASAWAAADFGAEVFPVAVFESERAFRARALRHAAELHRRVSQAIGRDPQHELYFSEVLVDSLGVEVRFRLGETQLPALLAALEAGTATREALLLAQNDADVVPLPSLAVLWADAQRDAARFPQGQPWFLRLAGVTQAPSRAKPAEELWLDALLVVPAAGDAAQRSRLATLRAVQAARTLVAKPGVHDLAGALAWSLFADELGTNRFASGILGGLATPEELERADQTYYALDARRLRALADQAEASRDPKLSDAVTAYRAALQRAIDAGHLESVRLAIQHRVSHRYGSPIAALDSEDAMAKDLFPLFERGAELGDPELMVFCADAFLRGRGTDVDLESGRAWLAKAAEAGNELAKTRIANSARRAAERRPVDDACGPLGPELVAVLQRLEGAKPDLFGYDDLTEILAAIWADARFDADEEDLAAELRSQSRKPLRVRDAAGATFELRRRADPEFGNQLDVTLPREFDDYDERIYREAWLTLNAAGALVGAKRVGPSGTGLAVGVLAADVMEGVREARGLGGARFSQVFERLRLAHEAARPELRAEFRALLRAAVERVEKAGFAIPAEHARATWLVAP